MSKLSEYSKFDHLDTDSEDDEKQQPAAAHKQPSSAVEPTAPASPQAVMRRDDTTKRFLFEYNGQVVYEWEQTLDEVVVYVSPPPATRASDLVCEISPRHLKLGLRAATRPFMDEPTFGLVDVKESTWCLEAVTSTGKPTNMIVIYLGKANKAVVWDCVLTGRFPNVKLNPWERDQVQKELLLERYQEENPGFDFRGADINGSVPDPRTFMGGVKYD